MECASCTFVYLRNPPEYKHLVSDFAWEKTRVAEVERRIEAIDEVPRAKVELVWDPPWTAEMMSRVARVMLGM